MATELSRAHDAAVWAIPCATRCKFRDLMATMKTKLNKVKGAAKLINYQFLARDAVDVKAGSMATACERQQIANKQNYQEMFITRF